eukprot:4150942-Alexandrium_andersonii.AAC.1
MGALTETAPATRTNQTFTNQTFPIAGLHFQARTERFHRRPEKEGGAPRVHAFQKLCLKMAG